MSHIVESCPLTKLNGGLSRLQSIDEDAVSWLTNYAAVQCKNIVTRFFCKKWVLINLASTFGPASVRQI